MRHAAIALGSLHEQYLSRRRVGGHFALQQYGMAMQHVLGSFKSWSSYTPDIAMLLCAMFAIFEILQGRLKPADTHIASGVKLVQERQASPDETSISSIPARLFDNVFSELASQVVELADPSTRSLSDQNPVLDLNIPDTFSTLEEAHDCFGPYLFKLIHMLYNAKGQTTAHVCLSPDEVAAFMADNARYLKFFQLWSAAFDNFLGQNLGVNGTSIQRSNKLPAGLYVLQIHRIVVKMLFSLDHRQGELSWDPFLAEMQSITALAAIFIDLEARPSRSPSPRTSGKNTPSPRQKPSPSPHSSPNHHQPSPGSTTTTPPPPLPSAPRNKQTFSISLGIVIPLYLVATRCRDPPTRRHAIQLLATCNRREGVWDAFLSSKVAMRFVQIEEVAALRRLRDLEAGKNGGGLNGLDGGWKEWENGRGREEEFGRAGAVGAGLQENGAGVGVGLGAATTQTPEAIVSMHQIPRDLRVMSMGSSFKVPKHMTVRLGRDDKQLRGEGAEPVVFEEHFRIA